MTEYRSFRASEKLLWAARIDAENVRNGNGPSDHAAALVEGARAKVPAEIADRGAGGELVPVDAPAASVPALLDTLANPNWVAADASRDRLDLAEQAKVLGLGLDIADTIGAENSLERMLAHQMAAGGRGSEAETEGGAAR
jgi:hypothetical protein